MPALRDIKNHIKSVTATGKLADAMKSISTAKYYRTSSVYKSFLPYAQRCTEMFQTIKDPYDGRSNSGRKCFVALTGNRGLCGGYNMTLMSFFENILAEDNNPLIIVCGKWGIEYFRTNNLMTDNRFVFSDIPEYAESASFASYLINLYSSGQADEIVLVYQKFKNILTQVPDTEPLLPAKSGEKKNTEVIYYPDREVVDKALYELCLKNKIYSLLLEWASGVHAATMMSMRTASDNAVKLKAELELNLNRRRQSQVTSGVMETAGSNETEEEKK